MVDTTTQSMPEMTPKAAIAFAAYVALGDDRSLEMLAAQRVAQKLSKNVPSALSLLKRWSALYKWQTRIATTTTVSADERLAEAAELDAETFLYSSRVLNERMKYATREHADAIVKMRESVRRPAPKSVGTLDVKHSGIVKHAHHDMSAFTDDEIEAMAAIAERRKAEAR